MSEENKTCSNEAMKKIIGNMTAEMQNIDGQYIPLGFTPPPTTEAMNWIQHQNAYISNHYNVHNSEPHINHVSMDQYSHPQQAFNYMPQTPHLFEPNAYKNNINSLSDYDVYRSMQNGSSDMGLFNTDYTLLMQQNLQHQMNNIPEHHTLHPHEQSSSHHTHLIENLVGNWMVPNNSGTYSPFGNSETYKPNVFDLPTDRDLVGSNVINQIIDEPKFKPPTDQPLDDVQFQFNRDTRKPRMVAEVKPMRPSYSDVLTKPVPQTATKPIKSDTRETKPKRESKKNTKSDKSQKVASSLNRSNTNNDIKDIPAEKNLSHTKNDKAKTAKVAHLSRKWASLDNIADPQINKIDDAKKKKNDDSMYNKNFSKSNSRKLNKTANDITDIDSDNVKNESFSSTKNGLKKISKPSARPKSNDSFGNSDRPPGKRNQRIRKKENHVPFGFVGQKIKQYTKGWWKIFVVFILWLFHLISDICSLSMHISRDLAANSWSWLCLHWRIFLESTSSIIQRIRLFTWIWEKCKGRKKPDPAEENRNFAHNGLQHNINMPTTGDEAMKRLLACKGKDPYSILGVTPTCTDDDIKRYYKRQAFLVHPDKNNQPGAEEAFKILVHAFDMIGEPERRASYDRGVVESAHVVQAWSELTELLEQLQQKVEAAANTIRCSACGMRHKRIKIDRPSYAARNCNTCKIHHAAREGDIWAEARVFGFLWHYYACMEGSVYDITDWAGCQKESLKHLRPDSHHVQYRIALGKQNNQTRRHTASAHSERPDLENLLNTLYGQNDGSQGARRRNKKGNK
ncbi:hypothetical protein NQ315_010691 [Exocentrus adspersus]|uniref:J domain-containing protein n=1 Tax=Exocentrus adspersus TaxID=1586481 RepID=A0AAV8VUF6_9CUCU|nr:hypothetical protein NQ315_010691 [Exocentrus adspersus]